MPNKMPSSKRETNIQRRCSSPLVDSKLYKLRKSKRRKCTRLLLGDCKLNMRTIFDLKRSNIVRKWNQNRHRSISRLNISNNWRKLMRRLSNLLKMIVRLK